MNTSRVLGVCIVGAEADVATRVNALINDQHDRLDTRWRMANQAVADLLLIDTESVHGHMDWLKACSSGRLVAALTNAPEACGADHSLAKPVVSAALVALLNTIGARLAAGGAKAAKPAPTALPATAASAPPVARPVDPPPAAIAAPATPAVPSSAGAKGPVTPIIEPAQPRALRLVDLLEADSPLKGRLRLAADGLPTLLLDPEHRQWHATSTLKPLSGWCTRALAATDVTSVDDKDFTADIAAMTAHPYARLKWLTHLVCGEDRLDDSLDPNGRYKLARWPQSEREFPRHFRIATVMLKQLATLDEIAAQSGATIADVANFINAYQAIGYVECDAPERPQEEARRGGLFARMKKASAAS